MVFKVFRWIFTLLFVVIAIAWIWLIISAMGGNIEVVPDRGALRIELDGSLVDELTYVDPVAAVLTENRPREHRTKDLIDAIDAATADERINSIVLVLHNFSGGGSSKIMELGAALQRFRKADKQVFAAADYYSQSAYLLASYADHIYMHPMAMVDLRGITTNRSYLADAIAKLKIRFHVFRTSEFKDAVEPLVANEMSDEARAQTELWVGDIWRTWRETIAANRGIEFALLDQYSNQLDQLMRDFDGDSARIALELGLVDSLLPRDQTLAQLTSQIGAGEDEGFYAYINYRPYLMQEVRAVAPESDGERRVGLITASGSIMDGVQDSGTIGGDSLAAQLKRSRLDDNLKALVLRIDSPGGSAFASEIIRRELELYREADIPVVVSMSSVAASGGYWIAAPANEIWAMPTTITGSIGAFIAVPTFEESLASLGIYSDGVSTGPLADALQLDRAMSEPVSTILNLSLAHLYGRFLEIVSTARDIPLGELQNLAEGRVWSGTQALELGLVDQLGGLEDAIASAAQLAGLEDSYEVFEPARPQSLREQIAAWFLGDVTSWLAPLNGGSQGLFQQLQSLGALLQLDTIQQFNDPRHQYLYCGGCGPTDLL